MDKNFRDSLLAACNVLNKHHVEYLVVGGGPPLFRMFRFSGHPVLQIRPICNRQPRAGHATPCSLWGLTHAHHPDSYRDHYTS